MISKYGGQASIRLTQIGWYGLSKMAREGSKVLHSSTRDRWKLGDGSLSKECKLINWNVNGFRSVMKKGAMAGLVDEYAPDILCLTETKVDLKAYEQEQLSMCLPNYHHYWNFCKVSRGYSGVAILSRSLPLAVYQDFELLGDQYAGAVESLEGRLLTLEFERCYLVNAYQPNAGAALDRLTFKVGYVSLLLRYIAYLKTKKSVVFCGDMNVAHEEIDLARPADNRKNAGFTNQQRAAFGQLLKVGLIDCYREANPTGREYTWWSPRGEARLNNIGWRIDYFLVDQSLRNNYSHANILKNVMGSDHCPISLTLTL